VFSIESLNLIPSHGEKLRRIRQETAYNLKLIESEISREKITERYFTVITEKFSEIKEFLKKFLELLNDGFILRNIQDVTSNNQNKGAYYRKRANNMKVLFYSLSCSLLS